MYSHFASEEEIVTAIAGEVPQGITSSLGPGLRRRAGSVPDEGAQSLGERGGVEAGAECELVEEGRAERGQDQRGVLIKSATGEEIIRVICVAAGGETVIPAGIPIRALAVYRESTQQRAGQALLESLTPRERQILAMMTHGTDNRTVAERLQISYATVRTHVRSILAKLGARSQLEAVTKARKWGFRG